MSNNGPKPAWQELYEAACVETNREKLTDLIHRTEDALTSRQQELDGRPDQESELREMKAAGQKLLLIKTEKLDWPKIGLDRQ
jgi:hypothetical protein